MTKKHLFGLCAACCAGALLVAAETQAAPLDVNTPSGYVAVNRKMQCSRRDGEATTYMWIGRAWSRVPGERDRLLFQVEGMNVRHCVAVRDAQRGVGYRLLSRELMLYKDPKTGAVLREWENPWTGDTVEVLHVANDPVNQRPSFGTDKAGRPTPLRLLTMGDNYFLSLEIPLRYTNPLGGDYQTQVGGAYHATEIFNFSGSLDELLDGEQAIAYPNVAWVRIAPWLPWMEMEDRPGLMYVNAVGRKLTSQAELSKTMRREISRHYPAYRKPPPASDPRPNETSWTYFKQRIDRQRAAEKAEKAEK